jgi:hypothetical protein
VNGVTYTGNGVFYDGTTTTNKFNDADSDWYSVHLDYKTDATVAGARLILIDDQTTAATSYMNWNLQGYAKMSMDNLWFGTEFAHAFGDKDTAGVSVDDNKWALLLEGGGKFGALDASLSYWWISGDNDTDATEDAAQGDAGNDWQPLLIMTHEHMHLLNDKLGNGLYSTQSEAAGQNVVMATFGMPVSDKMKVSSKIAYAWADDEDAGAGYDDEYGWEIDLGMTYKVLDNLTYGANFGYFAAGDFYTKQGGTADVTNEDTVMLLHHSLNMTF